jgi:hypothetical protein
MGVRAYLRKFVGFLTNKKGRFVCFVVSRNDLFWRDAFHSESVSLVGGTYIEGSRAVEGAEGHRGDRGPKRGQMP